MPFPAKQNPLDWTTQWWNILLGKKVDPVADAWLLGPTGNIGENAEEFINRLAVENRLDIRRNAPGAGLLDSLDEWGSVRPQVAAFYQRTSEFELETKGIWKPVFGSLGRLVAKLFSRRIQQLNLPHAKPGQPVAFTSDIIQLVNGEQLPVYTIWHRSLKETGEVVFYGVYTRCRLPSGELAVKAIFPLPRGNATVVFRATVDAQGNLDLLSAGQDYGEPGFYFLVEDSSGCLWKHYLPSFRENIRVFEDDHGVLQAAHSMSLWSRQVYHLNYRITEKQPPTG